MKNLRPLLIAVFCIQLIVACKKDKNPDIPTALFECQEFNTGPCNIGVTGSNKLPVYSFVVVNPKNEKEIAFQRQLENSYQIVKYDMGTGTEAVLVDDLRVGSKLSWSVTGWITFHTASSWKVWKVRDDGTQLTQLSYTPRDLGPEFHPDGEKIIYARNMEYGYELDENPDLRNQYKLMFIDLNGTPLDSFCRSFDFDPCYPWDFCSWSPDGKYFAAEHGPNNDLTMYGLAIYDNEVNLKEIIFEIGKVSDGKDFIADVEWHPDGNRIFFVDGHGINYTSVTDHQVRLIKQSCDNRKYHNVSISPDGKYLFTTRVNSTYSDCNVETDSKIVRMDIDGSNETVVLE